MKKAIPTLAIYWADTRTLLTYAERNALRDGEVIVDLTPAEVLILFGDRLVVIAGKDAFGVPKEDE